MSQMLREMIERSGAGRADDARPGPVEYGECGLCGAPVPDGHRHIFDLNAQGLACACRACVLLFDHDGAGNQGRHWRLVPERCVALDQLDLDDLAWRSLGLPVDLAFFVRRSRTGRVSALYPSPAGATECSLELESWDQIEAANPELAQMQPDVEALLINGTGRCRQAFLVGLDECYRLVAVIRTHWRGFGGGETVWREVESFFGGLSARAGARK